MLPKTFDVEHVFPKKWQMTNYRGWDENDAKEYLDKFGNKVAIEKKLNIQAGNNYFGNKKGKYLRSNVQDVRDLGNYQSDDWIQNDIVEREKRFLDRVTKYFTDNLN